MRTIKLPVSILVGRIERKRMLLQQARRLLGFAPSDPFTAGLALCESPIEKMFWQAAYKPLSGLGRFQPQYNVFRGRYRLDFALRGRGWKIVIECDGEDFHSSYEQELADSKRDSDLECAGWRIKRFSGRRIHRDIDGCVQDVAKLARAIR